MSDVWYYAEAGGTVGPLTLVELMVILSRVSVAKDVLVWRSGAPGWEKAGHVKELAAHIFRPPPLPAVDEVKKTDANRSLGAQFRIDMARPGGWWRVPLGLIFGLPILALSIFLFFTAITGRSQGLLETVAAWLHSLTVQLEARQIELGSRVKTSPLVGFKTPSNNIYCQVNGGAPHETSNLYLRCDLKEIFNKLPPKPSDCDLDWGQAFAIAADGRWGARICYGDTVADESLIVLSYGTTWQRGGFTCRSEQIGLTCSNASGHGFALSQASQRLF